MPVTKQIQKPRRPATLTAAENARGIPGPNRVQKHSSELRLSNRSPISEMAPGDIVFLDELATEPEASAPSFFAVLACPWCGSPGLITATQFSGSSPIVCTSKDCSGLFRIVNEAQIVPIPPI